MEANSFRSSPGKREAFLPEQHACPAGDLRQHREITGGKNAQARMRSRKPVDIRQYEQHAVAVRQHAVPQTVNAASARARLEGAAFQPVNRGGKTLGGRVQGLHAKVVRRRCDSAAIILWRSAREHQIRCRRVENAGSPGQISGRRQKTSALTMTDSSTHSSLLAADLSASFTRLLRSHELLISRLRCFSDMNLPNPDHNTQCHLNQINVIGMAR